MPPHKRRVDLRQVDQDQFLALNDFNEEVIMEKQERRPRKTVTIEDIEAQIRKLTEKKKTKQQSRWLELGKFVEELAKKGPDGFEQDAFFTYIDKVMKGDAE